MPIERSWFRFPPMCIGCMGTENLGTSRISRSYTRGGYRETISSQVPLCMNCLASAKHERKVCLIGGLVSLGVGIVVFALVDFLLPVLDVAGFMFILATPFITCFGFFDRAWRLMDLANKYAMLRGFKRDKITKEVIPKIRFKNAKFKAAYDEVNSADATVGQIAKIFVPTKIIASKPVTIMDTPVKTESTFTTRNCPDCAAELPLTAKFCNKCGRKF